MSGRAKKKLGYVCKTGGSNSNCDAGICMRGYGVYVRAVCSVRRQRGVGGGGSGTSLFYALARVI